MGQYNVEGGSWHSVGVGESNGRVGFWWRGQAGNEGAFLEGCFVRGSKDTVLM